MEKDFIQNDLERYAKTDDKEMTGSLNAALLSVAAIKQQLELVDDPQKYQASEPASTTEKPSNRGRHGIELSIGGQTFKSKADAARFVIRDVVDNNLEAAKTVSSEIHKRLMEECGLTAAGGSDLSIQL